MHTNLINHYDTLTTRPNRGPAFYFARHLRKRGLAGRGPGRLTRFGTISKALRLSPHDVLQGRLGRIFAAEYQHYMWRVRPLCTYCGQVLTRSTLTRDHVVPKSKGGPRGDNLVPACGPCNRAKADRSLLAYLLRNPAHTTGRENRTRGP
jgi:5-methylcytosine-specific restriction endonuclease McrA